MQFFVSDWEDWLKYPKQANSKTPKQHPNYVSLIIVILLVGFKIRKKIQK